ncbi:MAG: hypothetical protein VXZ24_01080, partial [Pseudomonadota bacterium]|nr:hypothetical protein [Pseudomonadota bacterium]
TLGITFREIENANLNGGTLAGSDAADSFEVTGTTLIANAISITNAASAISAGSGDDAVIVNDITSTLTGTDNALNTVNYQFTSIEEANLNGGTLAGSNVADSFEVTGTAMTANGISVTNAASAIDAGAGEDALTVNDANSTLTDADNALNTSAYQFTSIETADLNSNALTGTSGADTFGVTGANALTSADIDFTNVASVDAGTGDDQVNTNGAALVSEIQGAGAVAVDNALLTQQITFSAVENLDLAGGMLAGSNAADSFEVTGTTLTANAISIANAASVVNAGSGDDAVIVNDTISTLTGTDNALNTVNYQFTSIEEANLNGGALAGSDAADSFEVTNTALTANGISLTNVASAIDAGNGEDGVTVNDTNSTLAGTDNALNTANYQFTSIETADLNSNELTGTAGADTFDVTGTNALTSAGINFSNVEAVNAAGDSDQVNTDGADASLFAELGSAVEYALDTLGITFRDTENANLDGGALAGSSEADSFEVTGTTLTANEIIVTNAASTIDADTGDDAVTVNDTNSTLTGTDNALNTTNYQFTSIEAVDLQSNALSGSGGADT